MLIDFTETCIFFKKQLDKYLLTEDDFQLQLNTATIDSLLLYISNVLTKL